MEFQKSFFINAEVARIEKTENKIWFLVVSDDGNGMQEVTYSEFKEFLKEISYVCIANKNEELREKYIEFVIFFDSLM